MVYDERSSHLITGRSSSDSWYKAMQLLDVQSEITAGDEFGGKDNMTKDMNMLIELDEEAIDEILNCVVHPAFEIGVQGRKAYEVEFTYFFVYNNWHMDEKLKFVYNYMDRFLNYPTPNNSFMYQGNLFGESAIPAEYDTVDPFTGQFTGGFDQLKWLHDKLRTDGISRRHQIITWIPVIDDFNVSPPCLQRIWIRALVPKAEWYKYPGCIPLEAHIDYRSWDIGRAIPSNLYGLFSMLDRYICGNLTKDNEFVYVDSGEPVPFNELKLIEGMGVDGIVGKSGRAVTVNKDFPRDFKIVRGVLYGDAAHCYSSAYGIAKNIKPASSPFYKSINK